MSGKQKLFRFEQLKSFSNVYEGGIETFRADNFELKSKWKEKHFKNANPLILELACGKGEYSVNLARKFPERNFIGLDIKGARMYIGAKSAIEEELENAAFLRTRVEFITGFFGEAEVDEIWLIHPDPQLKKGREKKRLTSVFFVDLYSKILKPGALIRLKTDSIELYEFTLEEIESNNYILEESYADVYTQLDKLDEETQFAVQIPTHYERLFTEKGHKIYYLSFRLKKPEAVLK